jgi:lipocalin
MVTPVTNFDLKQFSGAWYEVLRSPGKDRLQCVGEPTVLYSLAEKAGRFASVRSCSTKGGYMDARNSDGRLAAGAGTGALKVRTIWPFWRRFDVVAMAPDGSWAVLEGANRKQAWVLSRKAKPDAETLTEMRGKVGQMGFDAAKVLAYP